MTTVADLNRVSRSLVEQAISANQAGMERAYDRTFREYGRKAAGMVRERSHSMVAAGPPASFPSVFEILDTERFARKLEQRTRPFRERALNTVAAGLYALADVEWHAKSAYANRLLDQVGVRLRDADASMRDMLRVTLGRALDEGWTVPQTAAEIQAHVYEASPAQATQLARTDLIGVANAASIAGARAVFPSGLLKQWLATNDDRTRPDHVDANGQTVPLDQPFQVGGFPMDYPGDPNGPDQEVCNCRCGRGDMRVSGALVSAAMRRHYRGPLVVIKTAGGKDLAVTGNHPVLTRIGWKAAEFVNAGDELVCAVEVVDALNPHEHDMPSTAEDVFAARHLAGSRAQRMHPSQVNFHGDVPNGQVEVVRGNDLLALRGDTSFSEHLVDLALSLADREMRGARGDRPLFWIGESDAVRVATATHGDAVTLQHPLDRCAGDPELSAHREHARSLVIAGAHERDDVGVALLERYPRRFRSRPSAIGRDHVPVNGHDSEASLVSDLLVGASGLVHLDPVTDVSRVDHDGWVFNLETSTGAYLMEGIITANCTLIYQETGSETVTAAAVDHSDGCMIALYPRPEEAAAIALENGQDVDDLHVTLAFLPEPPDFDLAAAACRDAAMGCDGILAGEVGGTGAFRTPDTGLCPMIALPDVVGLNELRARLVDALDARGVAFARNHGFTPHLTLAYADGHQYPDPSCHGATLTFDALTLKIGRDRYDFALAPIVAAASIQEGTMGAYSNSTYASVENDGAQEITSTAAAVEDEASATPTGGRWRASLCVEGVETEDGRYLDRGSISWRDLPLSLMALLDTGPGGHEGASVAGRMDRIWRDGDTVWAEGVFSAEEFGAEVERLVSERMVDGVSVDLAIIDYEIRDKATGAVLDLDGQMQAMMEDRPVVFAVTDAVIGTATVCPFQAIEGAKIEALVAGGMLRVRLTGRLELAANTITASAAGIAPELPPAAWFENPELEQLTPLTVTDDGRVFGHVAPWNACHTGYSGSCIKPDRGVDDYSLFHLGEIRTEEGDRVAVGQITMRTGHADVRASQRAAVEHYDHTGVAAADVRAGEDEFGIWVAGAVRPDLTVAQVRELSGAKASGDWRRLQGGPWRMLGLLAVNIPGYPIPRPEARIVASGAGDDELLAIVAAGIVNEPAGPVDETAFRAGVRALAARASGGLAALAELAR